MADAGILRTYVPGLAALALGAAVATAVGAAVPALDPLVVAIAVGVVAGNAVGVPSWAEPGVGLRKLFLETGIVLLGAAIALPELIAAGPRLALLVAATVLFGVLAVETVARVGFRLTGRFPSVLAAGSAICGVSAVAAVGRVVSARDDRLAIAAATILLFDAVTLVAFPVAGRALGLTGVEFGVWAGVSMFSTGPVAAAGFAFSETAGQWATVTKLARNALLGAVAIGYSVAYARGTAGVTDPNLRRLWSDFPKFLVGFFAVAAVANAGVLSQASLDAIGTATDWLFALAFVGLGTSIEVGTMREAGLTPVLVVLTYLLAVASLSLVAVRMLF